MAPAIWAINGSTELPNKPWNELNASHLNLRRILENSIIPFRVYGGFPKMVVPNNHGFFLLKWSFWGVLEVPPFKETPILKYGNLCSTVHIYTSTWVTLQDPPFVFTAAMIFVWISNIFMTWTQWPVSSQYVGESTVQSLRNHPSRKVLTILLWSMCFQCQAQQPRGEAGQRTSEVSQRPVARDPKTVDSYVFNMLHPFHNGRMEHPASWNTCGLQRVVGVAAIAYYSCHNAPSFLDPARSHNQVTPAMLALECKPITQKLNMNEYDTDFVPTKLTFPTHQSNFALGYESNPRIRKVKIATKYQSRCQQNKLTSSEASVAQRDSPNTLSKWDQHLCWKHTCPRCPRSTIGVH